MRQPIVTYGVLENYLSANLRVVSILYFRRLGTAREAVILEEGGEPMKKFLS